jgi:hypothetical protein
MSEDMDQVKMLQELIIDTVSLIVLEQPMMNFMNGKTNIAPTDEQLEQYIDINSKVIRNSFNYKKLLLKQTNPATDTSTSKNQKPQKTTDVTPASGNPNPSDPKSWLN